MTSILNLLHAIVRNPLVENTTKARACFLLWRLQGGVLGSIFDGMRR